MIKFLLPGVVILAIILSVSGFILSRKKPAPVMQTSLQTADSPAETIPTAKSQSTALPPLELHNSSESAILVRINDLSKQVTSLVGFDTKVDNLEKQIDDLNSRLTKMEGGVTASTAPSAAPVAATAKVTGPMYLYALGYGGSSPSSDWTELTTLNIAFDPSLYPGYKSLQLEAYMHVKDGNGKAFARLYTGGTAATSSEVSSTNYQDEWVSGSTFTWNSKSTFTLQVKSLTGYDTYISNARLKINF